MPARGRAPRVRQKRDDDESKADETRSGRPEDDVEVVPSLQYFHTSPCCLLGESVLGWRIDHNGLRIDSVSREAGHDRQELVSIDALCTRIKALVV